MTALRSKNYKEKLPIIQVKLLLLGSLESYAVIVVRKAKVLLIILFCLPTIFNTNPPAVQIQL
jgi:hypothetical protein